MPAASASGSTQKRSRLVSTNRPPAKANAKGRKPAARRACEIETRSAKVGKSADVSVTVSTASDPPSTNADQPRERPPEHDRRPAAQRDERRERKHHQGGDRDRAAAAEPLRREPVTRV